MHMHTHIYIQYIFGLNMDTCICVHVSSHINNSKKINYGNLEIKLHILDIPMENCYCTW